MNLGDLVQFYGASSAPPSKQPRNQYKNKPQYQPAPQQYNQPYAPYYVSDTHQDAAVGLTTLQPQTMPPVVNYTPQMIAPVAPIASYTPLAHAPNFVPPPPVQYVPPVHNKRPKPPKPAEDDEEGEFSCDACEKYFKTPQQHEAHLKSHVKCTYPGCTFNAAYSIVKLHKMRHLNSAIGKMETPEEINRYIEERKKRFPTCDVVAKKAEEEQRRRERGEIFDKNSRFNRKNNRNNNNNNKRNNRNEFPKQHNTPQPQTQELPVPPDMSNVTDVQSSGVESEQPEELKIIRSDNAPDVTASDAFTPRTQEHGVKRKRSCKYFMQGRCLKGEQCTFAHEEMAPRKKPRQSHDQNKKSSLLEKLLHTEIQKEHSAILQCFRHIIANNFFVQSTSSSAE